MPAFRLRRRTRHDDGAAAVEFAIVLIPLLAIVFGVITYGIIFAQQLGLGNAARQGARFAAVANRTCAQIEAETQGSIQGILAMPASGVDVTITRDGGFTCTDPDDVPCLDSDPGDNVLVEAAFISKPLLPLTAENDVNLIGRGTFRCEFSS